MKKAKNWFRRKFNEKNCYHRHKEVIKLYRRNYPFGRNSKPQFYNPPKKCMEVCEDCGKILLKWTPLN